MGSSGKATMAAMSPAVHDKVISPMILAAVFFPKFKKSEKRGFLREMTYLFGFCGPKTEGGGPADRVLSKNIRNPEIWPILGYFCLLWAGPAEQCCTPVYLPIEDFRQKLPFSWDPLAPKCGWGVPPTPKFSQTIKNPGFRPILEYFCLLWGGAAEQCCTPAYLYSIV